MLPVDLPSAMLGFVGVHLGLRAEVAAIEHAVERNDLDRARRRADVLNQVLHHHHRAEDELLFPALRERQPGFETATDALEAQHATLDVELPALRTDLGRASRVRHVVESHLAHEEQHVLPVWLASFTAEEHDRFATSLQRSTPLRDAGLMVAWLLDTAPDDAFELAWAQVPASLRAVHRVWWRRRYERRYGSLHGDRQGVTRPAMPAALALSA
jgi:hypothetical protein